MVSAPRTDADLVIKFDNDEAREHFALWLCGSGEQHYWDWMRAHEEEHSGNITATRFGYHGPEDETKEREDPARYGEFLCDGIIRTEVGRLDR